MTTNPIDNRAEQIADEIRANFESEEDSVIRAELEFHAACFMCAVKENRIEHLEQERDIKIKW